MRKVSTYFKSANKYLQERNYDFRTSFSISEMNAIENLSKLTNSGRGDTYSKNNRLIYRKYLFILLIGGMTLFDFLTQNP